MKIFFIVFSLLTLILFIAGIEYSFGQTVILEETEDAVPDILPEFIEEGAEREIENWKNIFGDEFIDVVNAMEAVKTGDVETFIRSGINILKVTPKILPKLGLDLIVPINENYLGNISIDPNDVNSGLEIGNQKLEIEDLESLDIENIAYNFALSGYHIDQIKINKVVSENSLSLISEELETKTKLPIKIEKGKLFILDKEKNEEKKIKRLPSYAVREINTRYKNFEAQEIKLEINDGRAVYNVRGIIDGKILWMIPVKFDFCAEYDAEKGALQKVEKPWWEIFVF